MSEFSPGRIVRWALAAGTAVSAVLARVLHDARFYLLSGAFGTVWTFWDVLAVHVFGPALELLGELVGQAGTDSPPNLRPTLDDTIRLLEHHLEHGASRSVEIEAGMRLEEIYRTVKRDPEMARAVIARVRERHPGARELEHYE